MDWQIVGPRSTIFTNPTSSAQPLPGQPATATLGKLPSEIIEKIIAEVMKGKPDAESVDFRDRSYANLARVNKKFFNAYLSFFTRFTSMKYIHSQVMFFRNNELPFDDEAPTSPHIYFNGPYIAAPGVLRLLASRRKLGALRNVDLLLATEHCAAVGFPAAALNSSPQEILLKLVGVWTKEEEKRKQQLRIQKRSSIAPTGSISLALDKVRVDISAFPTKLDSPGHIYFFEGILSLNSTLLDLTFYTKSLFQLPPFLFHQQLGSSPASKAYNRVTSIRVNINTYLQISPAEESILIDAEGLSLFPALEWRTAIAQLLALCPELEKLEIEFYVSRNWIHGDSDLKSILDITKRTVSSLAHQVLGAEPTIKMAVPLIDIKLRVNLEWDGGLPFATHALFNIGVLKSHQPDNDDGDGSCGMMRELVVVEDGGESGAAQSSSRTLASRKVLNFEVVCCSRMYDYNWTDWGSYDYDYYDYDYYADIDRSAEVNYGDNPLDNKLEREQWWLRERRWRLQRRKQREQRRGRRQQQTLNEWTSRDSWRIRKPERLRLMERDTKFA